MNNDHVNAQEPRQKLGEILLAGQKFSRIDLERALSAQQEMGGLLGRVLVRLGLVSESDVAQAVSQQLGVPLASAQDLTDAVPEVEGLLPEFLRTHAVCPIRVEGAELHVAMAVPQDAFVLKALHLATGLTIRPHLALEGDIEKALAEPVEEAAEEDGLGDGADGGDFVEHLKDLASEAPVIRLVNSIIGRVTDLRASDIHLEPFDDGLHVRYRVDGVIHPGEIVPPRLSAAVSSRVKLLAHLDIAERRLPQDGRIKTRVKGRELDLRVSTVPTVHGESVVMRVLDRASVRLNLDTMGFAQDTLRHFNALLARPHGILLVTGPTGSGKTTTLYASMARLDTATTNVLTVENPVEYELPGIGQTQVNPAIDLTFATALRAILRQDPDVIMIGEIRDFETAQIAIQASLTGHLVLATLHTNDAPSAVTRLTDMGVEPFLLSSSVLGALAQRLVRKLCPACKRPEPIAGDDPSASVAPVRWHPVGCAECGGTGYKGRTGVYELMVADDAVRSLIHQRAPESEIWQAARARGMRSMREDGERLVREGITSLEEVLRATRD